MEAPTTAPTPRPAAQPQKGVWKMARPRLIPKAAPTKLQIHKALFTTSPVRGSVIRSRRGYLIPLPRNREIGGRNRKLGSWPPCAPRRPRPNLFDSRPARPAAGTQGAITTLVRADGGAARILLVRPRTLHARLLPPSWVRPLSRRLSWVPHGVARRGVAAGPRDTCSPASPGTCEGPFRTGECPCVYRDRRPGGMGRRRRIPPPLGG